MQPRAVMLMAGVATMVAAGTAPAMAQESAGGIGGIEEVIVTAQKRAENLQKVPVAISAVSEETMDNMGIDSISTLVQAVPSLQYAFSFSNPQFTLRGITNYSNGAWIESGINLYVDGVYSINNQAGIFSFNNVERVEVLKGPQGTLFGRNSLGGVVSVTTKTPGQEPVIDVELGYGDFETVSGKFYGATGITDILTADLAVYAYDQSGGWGTNHYDNSELHVGKEQSYRTKWVLTPSDSTAITFIGDYDHNEPPVLGVATINGVYDFVNIGPPHVGGFWDSYLPDPGLLIIEKYGGSLTVDHDFGGARLVSITALNYSDIEKNSTRPPALPFDPNNPGAGQGLSGYTLDATQLNDTETFTQEFQVQSPDSSNIKWIAGAFILLDKVNNTAYRNNVGSAPRYVIDEQETESYAVFGQATFPVSAETRLTVGLRYTSDHKDVDGYGYNADGSIRPGDSVTANPEPSKTWEEPTYTLIVDRDFGDRAMGYASYSHGYQSGSYNISSSVNDGPVDPQIIDAFEIGLKSSTADNRLRINTSVFYYTIRDLLVSQNVDNTRITSNAAEAEYKGIDLDLVYAPTDNLTLTLGAAYTDPKYSDYQDATFYQPNPNGNGTYVATVGDATGNQIAYSEKLSGTVSASYVFPTSVGEFSFNGSVNYHDGAVYDAQGLLVQPAYEVVNASLRWVAVDSPWHVELWGNNLLNEKYATFFANTPVMYMNPSPPRTYGVSIGYHWR